MGLAEWIGIDASEDPRLSDDRWYGVTSSAGGGVSAAGSYVTEGSALTASVVFRCVTLMGWTVGSLPLWVMRWTDDNQESVTRALDHPLSYLLRVAPNPLQTAFNWRSQVVGSLLLRGNAYQRIVPGRRGFADQLMPIHVDRVQVEYLSGQTWVDAADAVLTPGGRLRYHVMPNAGSSPEVLLDEEVLHFRGYTLNGLIGVSVLSAMRNAVGLAQAVETFKSRLYANGTRLSGILKFPGALKPDARDRLRESWRESYSGAWNAGRVPILEHGLDFVQLGMNADDAQLLQAGAFQVEDLLRFLGIPGVLVGYPDKSATYASSEQFFLSFAKHSVEHWLANLEAELAKELILRDERYFVQFDRDPLVRGDLLSRWQAHQIAVTTQVKTVDEIRRAEGMNPLPAGAGQRSGPVRADAGAWAGSMARAAADRLVRREVAALTQWGARLASDPAAWDRWLGEFYAKHAGLITEALAVPGEVASAYVGESRAELAARGLAGVAEWPGRRAAALAAAAWACGAE